MIESPENMLHPGPPRHVPLTRKRKRDSNATEVTTVEIAEEKTAKEAGPSKLPQTQPERTSPGQAEVNVPESMPVDGESEGDGQEVETMLRDETTRLRQCAISDPVSERPPQDGASPLTLTPAADLHLGYPSDDTMDIDSPADVAKMLPDLQGQPTLSSPPPEPIPVAETPNSGTTTTARGSEERGADAEVPESTDVQPAPTSQGEIALSHFPEYSSEYPT